MTSPTLHEAFLPHADALLAMVDNPGWDVNLSPLNAQDLRGALTVAIGYGRALRRLDHTGEPTPADVVAALIQSGQPLHYIAHSQSADVAGELLAVWQESGTALNFRSLLATAIFAGRLHPRY